MNKKQKKNLYRIIAALVLVLILKLLPQFPTPVELLLYCIPYLVVGWDVLRKALLGIRNRQPFDECFLMAVATVGAFALGDYVEGCAVIIFYQIGELFQSVAVGKSRQSISSLMDIRPDYANVEDEDGRLEQVDPDDVEVGTVIVVQPGERVPIDGIIVEGTSALNTAALTGESLPRDVRSGDEVISGCVNMTGLLKVRTTKEFGESTVSKILDLVENSSMKKARTENFITRFARVYTPAVCYGALALAFVPPIVPGAVDADGSFFLRRLHRVDGQTAPVGSTECLFGRQKQAVAGKRSGESDQCKSDCTAKSGFQRASCTKNKNLHRKQNPSFVPSLCGQRRVEHQTAYRADKKERTSRLKASGCLAAQKWSAPGRQTKRERGSEWAISRLC